MKNNSLITSALTATLLTLVMGCSSSDDDSDASDIVTDPEGGDALIDCGTAEASNLSEADVGDLSDDLSAPTPFVVGPGVSTLTANTVMSDLDYATCTVGPCDVLSQLTVENFTSEEGDAIAFAALQSGSVFTVPFTGGTTDVTELLGYNHFGVADIGQDILPGIGEGAGAIGFTSPLPAGDYTIWLNQTGSESQATLNFQVDRVIEP